MDVVQDIGTMEDDSEYPKAPENQHHGHHFRAHPSNSSTASLYSNSTVHSDGIHTNSGVRDSIQSDLVGRRGIVSTNPSINPISEGSNLPGDVHSGFIGQRTEDGRQFLEEDKPNLCETSHQLRGGKSYSRIIHGRHR